MARSHHRFENTISWFRHGLPAKPSGTWDSPVLWTVWLVLVAVPTSTMVGQEMDGFEFSNEPTLAEENFSPPDNPIPWAVHHDAGPCSCEACADGAQWVNGLSGPYVRSGVSFVLGDGLLSESQGVGYTIQGGVRQPLGPGIGSGRTFLDLGGSYLSAMGELRRDTTRLIVYNNPTTPIDNETEDFQTTLTEVQRASAHAALGWYLGPLRDDPRADPQTRMAIRVGGRLSHVRGKFWIDETAVPSPTPPTTIVSVTHLFDETDTTGGLFFSTEMILLYRHTAIGNLAWTVDGEFAHDWIDFTGFEHRGLATAAVQFGVTITR